MEGERSTKCQNSDGDGDFENNDEAKVVMMEMYTAAEVYWSQRWYKYMLYLFLLFCNYLESLLKEYNET